MILDVYAALLTSLGIPFYTNNGFTVELGNVMISVSVSRCGTVMLSSYIGLVNFARPAKKLCAILSARYPGYHIWPEKMNAGYFEIEVEQEFSYTTVQELHEKVVAMAEMLEESYGVGKEIVGEEFHR